jgi:hypothetical protein
MSNNELFWINYEKWQVDSWEEFCQSEYYNGERRDDVEICDNGDVHFGNFHYIKECVTSWQRSKYFVY